MKIICCSLLLIIFCNSCTNRVPIGIIDQDKMEAILWDQMKAEAFTREYLAKDGVQKMNDANALLQQKIFAANSTTKEKFYKSYNYYLAHAELMKPMLDSIVAKKTMQKQKDFEEKMKQNRPIPWQYILNKQSIDTNKIPYKLKGIIIVPDTFKGLEKVPTNMFNKSSSPTLLSNAAA